MNVNLLEENLNKPCPCPIPLNGFPRCCVCQKRMCPNISSSFCSNCYFNNDNKMILERDQYGRFVDPLTENPLKTCKCGLLNIFEFTTDCKSHWYNNNSEHTLIRPENANSYYQNKYNT